MPRNARLGSIAHSTAALFVILLSGLAATGWAAEAVIHRGDLEVRFDDQARRLIIADRQTGVLLHGGIISAQAGGEFRISAATASQGAVTCASDRGAARVAIRSAAGGSLRWETVFQPAAAAESAKPNIIFILADDLGYGDAGCYGATKVKTPNLDQLARDGVRFTDAHSPSAVCTPTRYALLTGQYAWRRRGGAGILSGIAPLSIAPGTPTLPAVLKEAGYATAVVGKWHLGLGEGETDYNREIKPGPLETGFDYSFVIPATGDRVPCVYVENHRVVNLDPKDPIRLDYSVQRGEPDSFVRGIPRIGKMTGGKAALWNDAQMADALAEKAVAFIEQNRRRPFFLYFATHDIHVPRVPHPRFRGSSQAGVRGDVIQEFDAIVGEVLKALDRLALAQNTLLIVTSDNGGVLDTNGPDAVNSGTVETNNGHAFNGVLRGTKGTLYEGGTRVPFLARWPGKIKPGTTSDQLIAHVDMLATLAAAAGRDLPEGAGPDSFNVLPALLGTAGQPVRDHLVVHTGGFPGGLAVRQGPWKLIPSAGAGGAKQKRQPAETQLFDLRDDLSEQTNLAAQKPEKVQELKTLLEKVRSAQRSRP